jgi:beta-lactamase regulating signal transducer with metallopeptidase domain
MRTLLEIGVGNAVAATFLAAVAFAGARICRQPAVAHGLWLLVFVKLLTPPLLWIPISWDSPSPPPKIELMPIAHQPAEPAPLDRDAVVARLRLLEQLPAEAGDKQPVSGLVEGIALLWLAGSALWFGWTAVSLVRFRRLLVHAGAAAADLQPRVEELARRLGQRRVPIVALIPGQLSPMVWSFFGRPRLLFPARLLESVSVAQRDTLILHELAHLARRDHWVRWLELLASGLYWWLPVVWLARRALHAAEEECCDARVTQTLPDSDRDYALALVQTLAFLSPVRRALPPAASGVGTISQIQRRLTMILRGQSYSPLARLGGVALLALALVGLPWTPTLAQPPKEQPPSPHQLRQQQIEVLRQLLKTLEVQQQAEENLQADLLQRTRAAHQALTQVPTNQPTKPADASSQSATQAMLQAISNAFSDEQKKLADDNTKRARDAALQWIQRSQPDNAVDPRVKEAQWQKKSDLENTLRLQQFQAAQPKDAQKAKELQQLMIQIQQAKSDIQVAQAKLAQLQAALELLSKTPNREGEFEVIRLRSANAEDVAKILDEVFNGRPREKGSQGEGRIRVVADAKNNSVLVRASAADLRTIRTLLDKLDGGKENTLKDRLDSGKEMR